MDELKIFSQTDAMRQNNVDFTLDITNLNEGNQSEIEPFHFKFSIRSIVELEYAYKLYNLYINQVKPYFDRYKLLIDTYCIDFDRVFVQMEHQDEIKLGKTLHNSRYSDSLTLHAPLDKQMFRVPLRYGHVGHFRQQFQYRKNPMTLPIILIHFDFNYFHCYFRPIFKMLAKIENDMDDELE